MEIIVLILPILIKVDYMLQQMEDFENHQFDVLNESVDLDVNIVLTAKRKKNDNLSKEFFFFAHTKRC
jgi:hypothetical protein